tara:strand:+ start:1476 stop:1697 length:222 start_codon:yes stop_codon:yes gene_type:complete
MKMSEPMKKFRVKGSYTYKVEKIVEADNEDEAVDIALDSEPMCEWDSQYQDTYSEKFESVEEGEEFETINGVQ